MADSKPNILLHMCCGPCSTYTVKSLREEGFEVRGYFYNPNIHPYQEFINRLQSLKGYCDTVGLPIIIRDEYPLEEWIQAVVYREKMRCEYCYHLRLASTARIAKKSGYDGFTTTLLYSKMQKHSKIKSIAESVARETGIEFMYRDFRTGWAEGQKLVRKMNLYRQQYCGCIYSEKERHTARLKNGWQGEK